MRVPSITEVKKMHIFILTYPFRPLFIPMMLCLCLFGQIDFPFCEVKLVAPDSKMLWFAQLPFRVLLAPFFMTWWLLAGALSVE